MIAVRAGVVVAAVVAAGAVTGRALAGHDGTTHAANTTYTEAASDSDPSPAVTLGPPPTSTPPTPPTPPPPPVLRPGATGADVTDLQRRLAALGYQVTRATGRYDDETGHAVTAFEKVNGLPRDGIVGATVWAALDHPRTVTPRGHHPGLAMEVDLARQVALVVRDGRVSRVYDVSTGAPATPTPRGEFTVQYKIDGMRYAPLGPLWRPVYFTNTGIAFHGHEPVVTTPASHGCVRMTDPAMNDLFPQLHPGVPVSVY